MTCWAIEERRTQSCTATALPCPESQEWWEIGEMHNRLCDSRASTGNLLTIPYQLSKFQAPNSNTFRDILLTSLKCPNFQRAITAEKQGDFFFIALLSGIETHTLVTNRSMLGKPVIWKKKMSHPMTKLTKWHVCPAKTQISLGICPVWSESLLALNG